MSDMEFVRRVHTLPDAIGVDLAPFGGYLRCERCGHEAPLGDPGQHIARGWPKCCGYTMRWWTQSQIDAGEVSEVASK